MEQFGKPLKIHDIWSDPACGPRDAVIKVEACGICRSDYTVWNGGMEWLGIVPPLPAVLGHEYCGVVEEVGKEVAGFRKGDRVVSPFCHGCGTCAAHTVVAGPDAPAEIVELTGGGAHVSVDALGAAETTIPAIMSLRTRGRHLRLGASNKKDQGTIGIPVDLLLFREPSIVGSFGMQAARFPEMLGLVASGKLTPGLLVGDTVPLEKAGEVLASMASYDPVAMSVITRF